VLDIYFIYNQPP